MANHRNPQISSYSDGDLLALAEAVLLWLQDDDNLAKTKMGVANRTALDGLVTHFTSDMLTCSNKGNRTMADVADKDDTRKELLTWFSHVFQPFIMRNKDNIFDPDLVHMGYRPRPVPRKHMPPPTKLICLLTAKASHAGNVYVTASGEGEGIGKPADVDGVELEYYENDPRDNPGEKALPLGQFTNVKKEIKVTFPLLDYDRTVYIRGRWYNHNGKSGWSPLVEAMVQHAQ